MMNRKYSFFNGRWQPFHDGHKTIIERKLREGKNVLIGVRDTGIDAKNPYSFEERKAMIEAAFPDMNGRVKVLDLGVDIDEICYGRDVGYGITEIEPDPLSKQISASKIRSAKCWWLTGNSGSGKTTLSAEIADVIHLDGDQMRAVWPGLGFSAEDRREQNLRVARLARVLLNQGHNVVVSTICPFAALRNEIRQIIPTVKFVFLEGGKPPTEEYPYEVYDPRVEDTSS